MDVAWFDFRNSPTGPTVARGQDDERGLSDNFYTSSADGGRTWTKNMQVTDRSSDRSVGVWSNGFSSRFNMGVASTNDSVYFAWQDSRNGTREPSPRTSTPHHFNSTTTQLRAIRRGSRRG